MDVLIVLILIGGASVGALHWLVRWSERAGLSATRAELAQRRYAGEREHEIQTQSEQRALHLLAEFPSLSDEEIATLMRDELLNMRSTERGYFEWATPATVGRMRRTVVVEAVRAARNPARMNAEES